MNVIDIFASIAARDDTSDVRAIIPIGNSNMYEMDDAALAEARFRFCLLWGSALPFVSDSVKDQILSYIEELEDSFQKKQEEFYGISVHTKLKPISISSKQDILDPRLFHIMGGLNEILYTTPDKALAPQKLREFIIDDFKMVVSFVNVVGLVSSETGARKLHDVRQKLISFTEKWCDNNVLWYMSDIKDHAIEAQKFIKLIKGVIEELK